MFKIFKDNKEDILREKRFYGKILGFVFIICLIPRLFLEEEYISANVILNQFMDFIVIYFPKIEFYSKHAYSEIYYTIKLQLSIGIVTFSIVFIDRLYFFIKLYLFNFGILKLDKIKYFSKPIRENYTSLGLKRYLYQLGLTVLLALYFNPMSNNENLAGTSEYIGIAITLNGSYLWSSLISVCLAIMLSFNIIETLAQLYKLYKIFKVKIKGDKN